MALFRQCSSCRGDIQCEALYWVCSVSSCTRKRTGMFFCSVPCWEAHLPSMRHREAWAVEERAPSAAKWAIEKVALGDAAPAAKKKVTQAAAAPAVVRRAVGVVATPPGPSEEELARDILIVASKLKKYIRARSGFNTSDTALEPLSDYVRALCQKAIRVAGADGRKTVMDRDVVAAMRE